jgi:putative transposase
MSQDLRRRIVGAVAQGSSAGQAAQRFEVSLSAAVKLMQRVRQTGSTAPDKIGGYRRPLLEPHADALRTMIESKKGITLREIKAHHRLTPRRLHARGVQKLSRKLRI